MKCRQVRDLMGPYLYGDLDAAGMKEVRLHVRECKECREDLAGRGAVVSSLGDAVPELTDQERMRIEWAVKGAVRAETIAASQPFFRPVHAFALVALLVLGLVANAVITSRGLKATAVSDGYSKALSSPAAHVSVSEEGFPAEKPKLSVPPNKTVAVTEDTSRDTSKKVDVGPVGGVIPRAALIGANISRSKGRQEDKPAEVPVQLEQGPVETHTDTPTKLPRPTDLNDAQTTDIEP